MGVDVRKSANKKERRTKHTRNILSGIEGEEAVDDYKHDPCVLGTVGRVDSQDKASTNYWLHQQSVSVSIHHYYPSNSLHSSKLIIVVLEDREYGHTVGQTKTMLRATKPRSDGIAVGCLLDLRRANSISYIYCSFGGDGGGGGGGILSLCLVPPR